MISEVWALKQKCGHVTNIYVDAANPEVWQSLKREFNEPFSEQRVRERIAYARKNNLHVEDQMFIVPVPFSIEGAKMLQHTKWLLEEREEDGSNLTLLDPQTEEWICTRCNVSYYPNKGEKVKRANKFETPGQEPNIIVSIVDDSPLLRPKNPSFPRSLETLKRPGIKITEFHSTVDSEGL